MPEPGQVTKLKVFISYSRRDCSAFAQDLLTGLELIEFAPFLDRHDIAAGEDWEARLAGLIQASDTVVYVISPEAVKSPRCTWEIEKSQAFAKRIIPIVALAVPEADVPARLKQLNYIFFDEPHTFARSLGQLGQALRADLEWVREHTRLAELASRWQQRDHLEALLLRGSELEAATTWLSRWKAGAPDVTEAHRAFIAASSDAEAARANKERRQLEEMAKAQSARAEALADRESVLKTLSRRTMVGLASAGGLTIASAGLAFWGVDAERRFRSAREQAEAAEKRSVEEVVRKEASRTDIEGQLVAYAAAVGGVAMDGQPGENSPYTKAVLAELKHPGQSLQAGLARATKRVLDETNKEQRPYLATDLGGDIFLHQQPASRRRKALVFSVSHVEGSGEPLANVARDADAWEALLESTGFTVQRLDNPTRSQLTQAIAQLTFAEAKAEDTTDLTRRVSRVSEPAQLKPAGPPSDTLVAVFYSGFGVSVRGENHLPLSDTKIGKEEEVIETSVRLADIQASLRRGAAASVIILDTNFVQLFGGR